jgi:hypothetical protein
MSKKFLFFILILLVPSKIFAIDFWRYNELADRYSIFVGAHFAGVSFSFDPTDVNFDFFMPEIFITYVLPVGLPFSMGLSVRPLDSDTFGIGLRPAYHFNFNVPNLDVYLMYIVDIDISNTGVTVTHSPAIGARYRFGRFPLIPTIETGFMFRSIKLGFSLRLN